MLKKDLGKRFGSVLKEARIASGMSQEKLAFEAGLDRTYISMLERGLKSPTLSTLSLLSVALKIEPDVLVREMHAPVSSFDREKPLTSIKLPLLGNSLSCGLPVGNNQEVDKEVDLHEMLTKNPAKTFYVKAQGDSMAPTIQDGDMLVIESSKKPKNGSIVLAQLMNEFTVKRYFKQGNGFKLQPDNPFYKAIEANSEQELQVCGVINAIIRLDP